MRLGRACYPRRAGSEHATPARRVKDNPPCLARSVCVTDNVGRLTCGGYAATGAFFITAARMAPAMTYQRIP